MDRNRGYLAVLAAAGMLVFWIAPATAAEVGANASAAELGMLTVTVQVDGLSCPFCAYGLEKKLKKVENVGDLSIQIDKERAVLTPEAGTSLDLEEVEAAVRDGGFTPHVITLTARGRLTEFKGVAALELPNDTVLLLSDDSQTSALLESGSGAVVRVEGRAVLESTDGHPGHPYTLSISAFQVG